MVDFSEVYLFFVMLRYLWLVALLLKPVDLKKFLEVFFGDCYFGKDS
jgi:hypothetical protein